MDWVKLLTDYYRDRAIALGNDAAEVMFVRGIALAGEQESGGFIHDELLKDLTRRPAQAKKIASYLCSPTHGDPVWERVLGGYQILNWHRAQAELERFVEKKRRDKERKRRDREAARKALSADTSTDAGADSPAPRPEDSLYESEREELDAAAAAVARSDPGTPVPIKILASKLRQHTILSGLRTDKLKPEQATSLLDLIEEHGDQRLVDHALRTVRRDNPPQTIQAFLAGWSAMPRPGERLAAVPDPPCPEPGHSGTTKHCTQCASERLEKKADHR